MNWVSRLFKKYSILISSHNPSFLVFEICTYSVHLHKNKLLNFSLPCYEILWFQFESFVQYVQKGDTHDLKINCFRLEKRILINFFPYFKFRNPNPIIVAYRSTKRHTCSKCYQRPELNWLILLRYIYFRPLCTVPIENIISSTYNYHLKWVQCQSFTSFRK